MRCAPLLFTAALGGAVAAAIACGSGGIERLSDMDFDAGAPNDSVILGPDNQPAPTGPAGSGLATGLPCDVQALVENRCKTCHDGTTANAPRLLDYADFKAASKADPTKTMAQIALVRLKSTTSPMPPPPATPPNAGEIQTFEEWVNAGTPKGGLCTDPPPDGGVDAGDLGDAGPDASPGCASNTRWTNGNQKSPLMHPGGACNACHGKSGGPNLSFAGTVYRGGLHDVDDCNGTGPPPPVTVVISDKMGRVVNLTVNAAGNFYIEADNGGGGQQNNNNNNFNRGFKAPFRAKIVEGTKVRTMAGSVTSGDCNSCHTTAGKNGAPGRILAP
jgi:cytochrome c5